MIKPLRKIFQYVDAAAIAWASALHNAIPGGYISSTSAVLMDARTGDVLYGKAVDRPVYPASTTKVLTALLLTEYADARDAWGEPVAMSDYAVDSIGADASSVGLAPGDTLTLRECLYAILLASANEVCVGVAEHIAGTVTAFAELMNEKALAAGAIASHFTNPHGLPDRNHITTARDIALIMREAVTRPAFLTAIGTPFYDAYPNASRAPLKLANKNQLIHDGPYRRSYVVGGKTGYTHAARHTLVNYAAQNGAQLICVTMRARNYMTYPDTIALFDYGFAMYGNARSVTQHTPF